MSQPTAVIVDDSTALRHMIAYTLSQAGFAILEGGNGEEGLQHLKGQPVSVIITDLNMPVMDGISFIKQVRSKATYKFTPILMLTTETQPAKRQMGKSAGATGWIVKPFDPAQLVQTVMRVVR